MPRRFKTNWVYDFKCGDNIALNTQILQKLYEVRGGAVAYEKWKFNKPIILLQVSIAEACLCQLFLRIRHHTLEGVPKLTAKQIKAVRITAKDEFALYVKICRQASLLGKHGSHDYYERLDSLRELRNRIHIQNLENHSPKCEKQAFSNNALLEAEKVLEYVLLYVSSHYPRKMTYTPDITLPWDHGITV